MWNPWRALRALPHIELVWEHLPDGILAETDVLYTIWIDPRQRQAKRRCTIAHELAHIILDHVDGDIDWLEREADKWAARKLIQLAHLADALKWARNMEELAEELWVDMPTLETRLANLTPEESRYIFDQIERTEPWRPSSS